MALKHYFGYYQLIVTYLIWGSYGIFVRIIPFNEQSIVFFRFFFGLTWLMSILIYRNRIKLVLRMRNSWLVWLYSLFSVLSWFFFTKALKYTTLGHATLLIATAPIFVIGFAPIILKERLEIRSVLGLILSFFGIASIIGFNGISLTPDIFKGDLLAILASILYAAYILTAKLLPQEALGLNLVAYECLVGSLLFFPAGLNVFMSLSSLNILVLLIFSFLHVVMASFLYMTALRTIKAQHVAILTYIEPLIAIVYAIIFFNEIPTLWTLLGGIVIISGGVVAIYHSESKEL